MNSITPHLSDSTTQKDIEKRIVETIAQKENWTFKKNKKVSINGVKYEFDFYDEDNKIMGEVYVGIDKLTPGAKRKILTDCFKLLAAEKNAKCTYRKVMVLTDNKIKAAFEKGSWFADAIEIFGIELKYEPLIQEEEKNVRITKERQQKGNTYLPKSEPSEQQILQDLRDAVEEVNQIKAGKLNGIHAKELINEL